MPRNKNFGNREDRQGSEGYREIKTDLPGDRFSESKQVLNPDQLGGAYQGPTPSVTGTTAKEAAVNLKSKMRVAPDSSVEILEGKQVGGVPLEGAVAAMSVAGFSGQSAADDTSKIPYSAGNYRPDTRYGKKRSEDLFMLDNAVSEQVVPVVEESKDLRESPDAKQGYNGRKQFKQTRSKKNFGGVPQNLLQEAGVEIEKHDFIIHTTGQVIDGVDPQADYPTDDAISDGALPGSFKRMEKGNYHLQGFKITSDGKNITDLEFIETRIDTPATGLEKDEANMNWQVDGNNVAKAMIRMQSELGRETTDKWSPLAYVIRQPYQYNMLLHDIEATTGAIMSAAYRAAVSSMAFQRNIVRKDGVQPQKAAIKLFLENVFGSYSNSSIYEGPMDFDGKSVFNTELYALGSAAGLINMFDSIGKYRTKADILGLQRSLSLHLSQADNNLAPLHCKPEFLRILDKAHLFSTVDGKYNPLLPIHATKEVSLINPMPLNMFLDGWKNPHIPGAIPTVGAASMYYDQDTGTRAPYVYAYSDIRNKYTTRVQHPLVDGLVRWLLRHEGAVVGKLFGGKSGTVVMPATFDFMNPGMFEFLLCSASQDVLLERNIIFRDVLFAGEQSTYIWDDLTSLKENDPLHATQLTIRKYDEPLALGKLSSAMAVRLMWPEKFELMRRETSGTTETCLYMCPWHFNERAFSPNSDLYSENEGFKREVAAFNMTYPSTRDGVRHEYVDVLYGMEERDVRLAMDRMVTLPRFSNFVKAADNDHPFGHLKVHTDEDEMNSNIAIAALRYDLNSDGRLVAKYVTDVQGIGTPRALCEMAVLTVPKELGWIWDNPGANSRAVTKITVEDKRDGKVSYILPKLANALRTGTGSYEESFIKPYLNTTYLRGASSNVVVSYRVEASARQDGSIDRSAALTQAFWSAFADSIMREANLEHATATGTALAASYNDGAAELLTGVYAIDSASNPTTIGSVPKVMSFARSKWTMLQRYFRPINCFANAYASSVNDVDFVDPMEDSFYFGVCGTLASDYTQDILERLDTFDQLNLDYTEDVFTKDSLLFRE